jgi:hypothetical protein
MLFSTVKKVNLQKNEVVIVELYEGERIAGIVDDINGEHFWLRASPDPNSKKAKFSFKIDKVIKLN